MTKLHLFHLLTILCLFSVVLSENVLLKLTEDDWSEVLHGEWLLEFYAPWCPACKNFQNTLEKVAEHQQDLKIKVAQIDVTTSPSLSGRFMVTSLPTVYHIKDNVFRIYSGHRSENNIVSYIENQEWQKTEPVAWYWHPSTPQMTMAGFFIKLSIAIKEIHERMTEDTGIPVWASYLIFAVGTIVVGLILGIIMVFCFDCLISSRYPPPPVRKLNNNKNNAADGGDNGKVKESDNDENDIADGDLDDFEGDLPDEESEEDSEDEDHDGHGDTDDDDDGGDDGGDEAEAGHISGADHHGGGDSCVGGDGDKEEAEDEDKEAEDVDKEAKDGDEEAGDGENIIRHRQPKQE